MSTTYLEMYRCLLCNCLVSTTRQISDKKDIDRFELALIEIVPSAERMLHQCQDGGRGIAVFVGLQKQSE